MNRSFASGLAACAVLLALAGRGEAGDDTTAAAAHFKEGRKLYTVGEYQQALEAFKQAYLAHEDSVFLFNIGQCHRQMGAGRDALTFYRRYLAASPQASNRAEVEKLIREIEAKAPAAPGPPPPAPDPPSDAPMPAAAPPPPPVPATAAPVEPPSGIYVEVGLGGGGLRDDFDWILLSRGSATGGSGVGQIAIGWGVHPKLVLGAMASADWVQSPRIELGGRTSDTVSVGVLGLAGVFGELRLEPAHRTGLHFQAAIGGARMSVKDKAGKESATVPIGGGVMLGCGYDWALTGALQWGVLGRFVGATMSDQGFTHRVETVAGLLTLSYR